MNDHNKAAVTRQKREANFTTPAIQTDVKNLEQNQILQNIV